MARTTRPLTHTEVQKANAIDKNLRGDIITP